jgi:hypothetical protein
MVSYHLRKAAHSVANHTDLRLRNRVLRILSVPSQKTSFVEGVCKEIDVVHCKVDCNGSMIQPSTLKESP